MKDRGVDPRHRLDQGVEAADDEHVDPEKKGEGDGVENRLSRDQVRVQEAVADHRVGDRDRPHDERHDDQGRSHDGGPERVEERRNRNRDRVETGARGEPIKDGADLRPDSRVLAVAPAVPENRERRRDVGQVHQREEDLVEPEDQLEREAAVFDHLRSGRILRDLRGDLPPERALHLEDHEDQVEQVRGEDPEGRERNPSEEAVLLGENAGEEEERGEEELPDVVERAEEVVRTGPVRPHAVQHDADRPEHRADSAREEHQRRGAVGPLARRLAEDDDSKEQYEGADHEVGQRDRRVAQRAHAHGAASSSEGSTDPGVRRSGRPGWSRIACSTRAS